MTKLCSVCHTDNKDEAQFCRSCGTSFAASAPASATPLATAADGTSDNICGECGFQNKAGIRYCANCGMSLTAAASGFGDLASKGAPTPVEEADPYAGLSPPPISYTSFPPVAPYPPAPAAQADDETPFGNLLSPDIPDADAAIAARQSIAADHYAPPIESGFSSLEAVAPAPDRARMVVIGGAIALLVAGAAAWWFMGSSPSSSSSSTPAPAPVAAPSPVVVASAPTPILIIETARAPAPAAASTPAVEVAAPAREAPITPAPSATAATSGTLTPPPAAAAPLPQQADVAPMPVDAGANDAKKLATDKARREKAARDKADRDAKAKAVSDQRDQAAASARAEQEAQARRRAEEAQRTRVAPVAPAPLPAATEKAKGVREICAGRGTIAEAVCQSRQCASPEHANEAICRQIREADDRRRNYQN